MTPEHTANTGIRYQEKIFASREIVAVIFTEFANNANQIPTAEEERSSSD
jgi:hypothetical protein